VDGRVDFELDMRIHYGVLQGLSFQAHLAGSGTILRAPLEGPDDAPGDSVGARADADEQGTLLVIADGRGRVRRWMALRDAGLWRRFVALVCEGTPREYLDHLSQRGVEWIERGEERVDLPLALEALGADYGVEIVLLDSGGTLNAAMLRAGVVDEISLLLHPRVVGHGTPLVLEEVGKNPPPPTSLTLKSSEELEEDILWLRYDVRR
jgi:riboflavin biosynthesis pyrimidine reductase